MERPIGKKKPLIDAATGYLSASPRDLVPMRDICNLCNPRFQDSAMPSALRCLHVA
jgi:hypothetical protein